MQQKKITAYIIISLLCLVYAVNPQPNIYNAILCHANIFHLLTNIIAIWSIYTSHLNVFTAWKIIPACYLLGTIGFTISPTPAVGASAFVYALLGSIWAKNTTRHNTVIIFFFSLFSFLPQIATTVHLFSLLGAFTLIKIYHTFRFIWNHV